MKRLTAIIVLIVALALTGCQKQETTICPHCDEEVLEREYCSECSKSLSEEKDNKNSKSTESLVEDSSKSSLKNSLKSLEKTIDKDVEDTIFALKDDYENLVSNTDTYSKYKLNTQKIEAFYDNVLASQKELTIRLREYSLTYAELILNSNIDTDDKYDEIKELYDVIYDEAGSNIYDEIYNGILDDLYDDFYNGILDDAYGTVQYSELSNYRSKEYKWWSDTRSDVYKDWSNFRSDVYDFWSDLRSELWDDDIEEAREEVEYFKEDINKLKER